MKPGEAGIDKINQGFHDAGKPDPLFEELGGGFMITLFKGKTINVTENVTDDVTDDVTDNVTDNVTDIVTYIVTYNVTDNLAESRLVLIMNEFDLNPKIS